MSNKAVINTEKAPAAIGPYSQVVKAGITVYLSGQIPLNPETMEIVSDDFEAQARQVSPTQAVGRPRLTRISSAQSPGDLDNFAIVNKVMEEFFPRRSRRVRRWGKRCLKAAR